MSESQERMMAVVEPAATSSGSWRSAPSGTCWRPSSARSSTAIGCSSTGTASASSTSIPAPSPTRARCTTGRSRVRGWIDDLNARARPTTCRGRPSPTIWPPPCSSSSASPNQADKSWVTDQYDRYVRGNSVLAQPEDAGMLRTRRGVGARHRAGHRLQRPLHPAQPLPGRPAGARARPTATWPSPAPSRWRSPTASTSARRRTRT